MLKRIHVSMDTSHSPKSRVSLEPLTVLFGPNAAGKSNFLDALQLLSKLGTSRTLKEAFDPPYRGKPLESFTIGRKGIKGLLEQEMLSFCIEADLHLSNAIVDDCQSADPGNAPSQRNGRDSTQDPRSTPE